MVGFTGVVWFPRGATINSTTLYAGPGPVPMSAASAAWADLTALLGAGAAALTAAVGGLGATWQGP
ncbi:PPE domain-containing protein, partial [Tomitella cavernea]